MPDFSHLLSDPAVVVALLRHAGLVGPLLSVLFTVASSLVLVLPTAFIVFANALMWGFVGGTLITFVSSLLAACVCFWLSRRFGRPLLERIGSSKKGQHALELTDRFFDRYGARAVLVARLLPVIPFDLVSLAAGLTDIRFGPFLAASAVGMLPAIVVYSWLASFGGQARNAQSFLLAILIFIAGAVLISIVQKPLLQRLLGQKGRATEQGAGVAIGEATEEKSTAMSEEITHDEVISN